MRKGRPVLLALLATCTILAFLAAPPLVAAQGIDVSPDWWDFGDVEVGSSETVVFSATSQELVPLSVYSVEIVDDASGSFTIVLGAPPPSVLLYQGESIDVSVEFAPSGPGAHTATMRIDSDAEPPDHRLMIPLQGVGFEDQPCGPDELPCDVNSDCVVDRDDLMIVLSHRNQSAEEAPECDLDEDGTITVLDARRCVLLCTCPRCVCDEPLL